MQTQNESYQLINREALSNPTLCVVVGVQVKLLLIFLKVLDENERSRLDQIRQTADYAIRTLRVLNLSHTHSCNGHTKILNLKPTRPASCHPTARRTPGLPDVRFFNSRYGVRWSIKHRKHKFTKPPGIVSLIYTSSIIFFSLPCLSLNACFSIVFITT